MKMQQPISKETNNMTEEELKELTDIKVMRLMALKKDLEGPCKDMFLAIWGEEEVAKYKEIIRKLIELKKTENKHHRMDQFWDISEIKVEDCYD